MPLGDLTGLDTFTPKCDIMVLWDLPALCRITDYTPFRPSPAVEHIRCYINRMSVRTTESERPMPEVPLAYGIPDQEHARNTIVTSPAGLDTDPGPYGSPHSAPDRAEHPTPEQIAGRAAVKFSHLMAMIKDQAFDYTHPVDEYAPQGMSSTMALYPNIINVQPDYDMPERIEALTVIIPVGATLAVLQLGQRSMTLYSGPVITTPIVTSVQCRGIILNSDDLRTLTITGALTTAPYLGLCGWALTRGQFSLCGSQRNGGETYDTSTSARQS